MVPKQMARFHKNLLLPCSVSFITFITIKTVYTDFWSLRIQSCRCQENNCSPCRITLF